MKRRVIMLQKMVHLQECLKCAHENGCTLGYLGKVRLLSGTSVDEGKNFRNKKKKEKFQNEKHKKRSTRDLMNELRESKS